jgi:hypothetical protein
MTLLHAFVPTQVDTFETALTATSRIYPLNITAVNHSSAIQTIEIRLVKSGESNAINWSLGIIKLEIAGDKGSTINLTSILAPVGSIVSVKSTSLQVSFLMNGIAE